LYLLINTSSIADYYNVIPTIGSEENSVTFCLKSESDSYYFSLAIWNSITEEYPNNYASAIRLNIINLSETATKTKYRNELNAALEIMIINLSSIKPNIKKIR